MIAASHVSWSQWRWPDSPLGLVLHQVDATSWFLVIATLALSLALGALARKAKPATSTSVWLGLRGWDGLLPPLIACAALWVLGWFDQSPARGALFGLVIYLAGVWAIHLTLDRVLPKDGALLRSMGKSAVALALFSWVLWAVGLLPLVRQELDAITWHLGGTVWTLSNTLEGIATTGFVLLMALWVSSALESHLLKGAGGDDLSLRKMLANSLRVSLVFVGLMIALSLVGIDLTALSVLGGAIGVGIGFGLQKLASNYVSGFVILGERSVRIGDIVKVDGFEGTVVDIRGRYTVLRSAIGIESIVPNEILITSRVENLSLADPLVWLSTEVRVAYNTDPDLVIALLEAAAAAQDRVLIEPAPRASLKSFEPEGLLFVLGFWIEDVENGRANITSAINLDILKALRQHHIEIPSLPAGARWVVGQ